MGEIYDTWRWSPGELVKLINTPIEVDGAAYEEFGIILSYYDSNVYEPASVDVLIGGQQFHMSTRDLIRLKEVT